MTRIVFLVAAWSIVVLVACSGQRTEPPGTPATVMPVEYYRAAAARGEPVYCIDADESLVTVYVYRDGPLARLGHDHVVAGRDIQGFALVAEDVAAARADLMLSLTTLSVDEAVLREEAGFESGPSAEDIAGTRANMLSSLEAELFPNVYATVTLIPGSSELRLNVEIRLHGVTESFEVPVALVVDAERLEATGSFNLQQTQFGISPFSVFGGALSVADQLNVFFRLRGSRCYSVDSPVRRKLL